jgi:hypothetical protein
MKIMDALGYADIVILITLSIVITLFMIGAGIALKRGLARRSRLYIEVKKNTHAVLLKLITLDNGMRFYRAKIPSVPIAIEIKNHVVFAIATLSVDEWRIKNTLTNQRMVIPTAIWLLPYTAFKLQRNINEGGYTVDAIMMHNHEFSYLTNTQTVSAQSSD